MTDTFSPGDIVIPDTSSPTGKKEFSPDGRLRDWAGRPLLVLEAKHLNQKGKFKQRWRQVGWVLTVMKLDGSSEVVTTYFNSDIWATVATISVR